MLNSLIIGMGQIGDALLEVIGDAQTLDVEPKKISKPIDIMHIAIPYSDNFVKIVKDYQTKYSPLVTVIYSTVPIGTSKKLNAMHSPVEGIHPYLADSIRDFPRYIGTDSSSLTLEDFWGKFCDKVIIIDSTKATEFLKLRSTSKYGINLVWADYEAKTAEQLGVDYQLIKDFDEEYNKFYKKMAPDDRHYQRYILDPPKGKIGGHCVVPNAKLLKKHFPSTMLDMIEEME